jgi:hypothetical protein
LGRKLGRHIPGSRRQRADVQDADPPTHGAPREDHDDNREVLTLVVEEEGLTCVAVRDGHEALDRLRAGLRPCVILPMEGEARELGLTTFLREPFDVARLATVVLDHCGAH